MKKNKTIQTVFYLCIFSLCLPYLASAQYPLVWSEEFDYTGLPDSTKWKYDVGGSGWGNNELQYYTENRLENARVENGSLIIEARQESYQGSDYTSARLVSVDEASWLYGRVEVRAKIPTGKGTWSAIWMLPTDWAYGGWPNSGEIDIMEHVGYDPGRIHGSTHSLDYNFQTGGNPTSAISIADVENTFHVYAMEWWPDRIEVFVDDVLYFTSTKPSDSWTAWPFDQRFHVLLNIAVGGDWGGAQGVDQNIWPEAMEVDYVRVYDFELGQDDQEPPTTPTNLTAASYPYSLQLTWDHAQDNYSVAGYIVYQEGIAVDTVSANSTTVSGLQPLSTYNFQVQAMDVAGNLSEISTLYSGTTTALSVWPVPGLIEAESFNDALGIQLETCEEGTDNVGWFDDGDYMVYRIDATAGLYTARFRVASASLTPLALQLTDADNNVLASLTFDGTGGWQSWTTVTSDAFTMAEGIQDIYVKTSTGNVNLNWFGLDTAPQIPGLIQAEDYTEMSGIQTETTTDGGGGLNVGWLDAGDYLTYQVYAAESGDYEAVFRTASQDGGGSFDLYIDQVYVQNVTVPSTGGWQIWTDKTIALPIDAGAHTIQLQIVQGGFNLNWIYFDYSTVVSYSEVIEAETYSSMSGVQVESTSDTGGGQNVGWIDTNDWMEYWVDLPQAGTYDIAYRVASPNRKGVLTLSQNQQDLSSTNVPRTGGWQKWQTVTTTVNLNQGVQPLVLYVTTGGFNLNWWSITLNNGSGARSGPNPEKKEAYQGSFVYPNPASNLLNVDLAGAATVRLIHLNGSVLPVPQTEGQHGVQLSLDQLKPGMYLLQIQTTDRLEIHKIVKQ